MSRMFTFSEPTKLKFVAMVVLSLASICTLLLIITYCRDGRTASRNLHISIKSIKKCMLHTSLFSMLLLQPHLSSWASTIPIENTYISDHPKFSFKYTSDLKLSPKLLKTHNTEVFLKSEEYKGFNVGITVSNIHMYTTVYTTSSHDICTMLCNRWIQ